VGGSQGTSDNEYWGAVRRRLELQRDRARLAVVHAKLLATHPGVEAAREAQRQAEAEAEALAAAPASTGPRPREPKLSGKARRMMSWAEEGGENEFAGEIYEPSGDPGLQKPKYFNRVHTGYEWSKYNQTHYDSDNPPPKVVQGYKFNLFYPELQGTGVTPKFKVVKDPDSQDGSTCIIKFVAGKKYEDIAFRIINKEWEYTARRGYKCTWERGILHVYFNFKRQRYRR